MPSTVPRVAALAWVVVAISLAAAAGAWLTGAAWAPALAVVAGLALALGLVGRSAGRLGGINGDVLGAAIESATTIVLVVLAVGASVSA